ncbi:MAG: DUF5610 domain-containing protein [Deltaproteobacteria bacterium]|nr:DUF5610 domain-containing protein [Deltaproteobacteria bacterium]
MESLLVQPTDPGQYSPAVTTYVSAQNLANAAVLDGLSSTDSVDVSFSELFKSLSLTARRVIEKLNELLQPNLPGGVQSLNPDEWTPEATADRIVTQVTALFSVYAKRHSNLEGEELLNGFMDTIRSGVDQGYGEAFEILGSLGAFEFEGVQSGVEKTKSLIEQKLSEYEAKMRVQLGIDEPDVSSDTIAESVKTDMLASAGVQSLDITA